MPGIIKHFVTGIAQSLDELFTKSRHANKKETVCIMDGLIEGRMEFPTLPDIATAIQVIHEHCKVKNHWIAAIRDRLSNSQYQDVLVVI